MLYCSWLKSGDSCPTAVCIVELSITDLPACGNRELFLDGTNNIFFGNHLRRISSFLKLSSYYFIQTVS